MRARLPHEWVVFITGLDGWAARHKLRNQLCVVIPNVAVAMGHSFGPDPKWDTLANSGFRPLALNRAISGACSVLANERARPTHATSQKLRAQPEDGRRRC